MTAQLQAIVAMRLAQTPDLFGPEQWRQLEAITTVPDRRPLESFGDQRARDLLRHTDVLVTGWGCPEISAEVVNRLGYTLILMEKNMGRTRFPSGSLGKRAPDMQAI